MNPGGGRETGDGHENLTVPARFENFAALQPSRLAIIAETQSLTYHELNATANRLAHTLMARGGSPGDRVALLFRHDAPLLAAVLAVLKCGRAVVVLNPGDPPARLQQVLDDAAPGLVLADAANHEFALRIVPSPDRVLRFNDAADAPVHNPGLAIAPDDLAVLLYTSGSTGRPKGVMQSHQNVLHNVRRVVRGMGMNTDDRILLLAALSGGQGVNTAGCALLNGATLCPFPAMEKGVIGLADWMAAQRISVYVSSTSVLRYFLKTLTAEQRFADVRLVRLASEPANAADVATCRRHFSEQCAVVNALSASETGNLTQWRLAPGEQSEDGPLPVGRAAEGIEVRLLNEVGGEVRDGEPGEIVVRSRYLSPGYWRDDALTAQRFSGGSDPNGVREFRTGDLGRWIHGDVLMFLGRKDARVKVHGYRIEVSEVENALNRQPGVERAIVGTHSPAKDELQLVAWLTTAAGRTCDAVILRQALRSTLPTYMVPSAFVFLESFPLNAHGKIDRARLLPPGPVVRNALSVEPPVNGTESLLAGLWQEILGHAAVGRQDDFFELGGDSLKAAMVAARVGATCGVDLDLRAFADHPRLADFAVAIDQQRGTATGTTGLTRVPREGLLPLSFEQERTWRHSRTPAAAAGYTKAYSYRLRGPLDVEVLRETLAVLLQRHEILRTTFHEENGRMGQNVGAAGDVALTVIDLSGAADAEAQARRRFREEARRPFDLSRLPLLRFTLVRLREQEYWLLRLNHHIISDAWTWTLYFRELAQVYEARRRGETPAPAANGSLHYADYAVWQRRMAEENVASRKTMVDWWAEMFANQPLSLQPPFRRFWRFRRVAPSEGWIRWGLEPAISQRLDQFGREAGFTYYTLRLAAFFALLSREAGLNDAVIGTYATRRTRVELQEMFGHFANLMALRLRCDSRQTFRAWAGVVRDQVNESQARSELAYEDLGRELRARGIAPPVIQVIFSITGQSVPKRFADLEMSWLDQHQENMPWGFSLAFDQEDEGHSNLIGFDANLYHPTKVRAFISRFTRFLEAISCAPDKTLAELL